MSCAREKESTWFDTDENYDELEMMGLDRDELEYMDKNERRESMDDAVLDLDDLEL